MAPATEIWVPTLALAHVFALCWLAEAVWRSRPAPAKNKTDVLDSNLTGWHRLSLYLKDTRDSELASSTPAPDSHAQREQAVRNRKPLPEAAVLDVKHSRPEPMTVSWQGLGCSYTIHGAAKVVLQDVWGEAQPGEMQALMGPSGAGKSTLMDMLAMRKSVGSLTGKLLVNGSPATASCVRHTSYVPQDDTFIPTMTSGETLTFYAGVTLGARWTSSSKRERVAEVLQAVGLGHSTDTLVGGTLPGGLNLRGLSGGERKRLSIAAGILGAPSVLFLDEPTSGLDSFAALSVMGHLQTLALTMQQTIIATIHQPRSAIWEMFNKVSLLASGRLMYHGPCAGMIPWFESLGYSFTKGCESDWVLDLVATGFSKPEHLFGGTLRTKADIDRAAAAFLAQCKGSGPGVAEANMKDPAYQPSPSSFSISATSVASSEAGSRTGTKAWLTGLVRVSTASKNSYPTSWWREFKALLVREVACVTRNPFDIAARVLTTTYIGLVAGLLAYKADFNSISGLQSKSNYMFGSMLFVLLLPYVNISLYTSDKKIYLADVSAKRYRASAYYTAKVLIATPFTIIASLCYSGLIYGLSGMNPARGGFGRFACIIAVVQLIANQALHLCAVVCPNYDFTFALAVVWTTIQQLFCSFYIRFSIVWAGMQWLTQLRYLAASYFALEGLMINELHDSWMDCSSGVDPSLVDTVTSGLVNASSQQKAGIEQLKEPQPGCVFKQDVLLSNMEFTHPFEVTVGILLGYLGVLHVLTFLGLLLAARRERR